MMLFKFKLADPDGNELIDQDFFITVVGKDLIVEDKSKTELCYR